MMRRPSLIVLFVALASTLGACGDCCLDNGDSCHPRPAEPRECVWLRGGDESRRCAADPFEPNDDMPSAAVSRDGHECEQITKQGGVLSSATDVDVYRTGNCHMGLPLPVVGSVDPTLEPTLTVRTAAPLRACIFPTCSGGSTNVYECWESEQDGTQKQVDPTRTNSFFRGCCRFGGGTIRAVMNCPLSSGEIDTYFWIDSGDDTSLSCVGYELSWNLD